MILRNNASKRKSAQREEPEEESEQEETTTSSETLPGTLPISQEGAAASSSSSTSSSSASASAPTSLAHSQPSSTSSSSGLPAEALTPRGAAHGTGRLSRRPQAKRQRRAAANRMGSQQAQDSNRNQRSEADPQQRPSTTDQAENSIESSTTPTLHTARDPVPPQNSEESTQHSGLDAQNSGSPRALNHDNMFETFMQQQERQTREAREARIREEQRLKAEQDQQALERERAEKEAEAQRQQAREAAILRETQEQSQREAYVPLRFFASGDPTGWLPQEHLNAEIQMRIIESVGKLRSVGTQLERVLEIDRLTIGNDRHLYEYTHESFPDDRSPHGVQKRTLLALKTESGNVLEGSSVEECESEAVLRERLLPSKRAG